MASLKCSKCGYGIHYHGIPSGVEYIMFEQQEWQKITASRFLPDKKEFGTSKYPKLFRADTIEEDFPNSFTQFWMCPMCRSIAMFDNRRFVIKVMEPADDIPPISGEIGSGQSEGVIFDDYTWDKLTESALPNQKITQHFPASAYVVWNEECLSLFFDEAHSNLMQHYKRFEIRIKDGN